MRKYIWDVVHKDSGESVLKEYQFCETHKDAVKCLLGFGINKEDYIIVPVLDEDFNY